MQTALFFLLFWLFVRFFAPERALAVPPDLFPAEVTGGYRLASHTIAFESPLTAVVALDRSGRPTTAKIQSARLMLL